MESSGLHAYGISKRVHIRREGEAGTMPNRIGNTLRRTSDVRRKVRAGHRHGPRVAVPCRHDQTASPDRLRASRYFFFVDVCIVSLSGKSQTCVSVCNVEMQCLLAKWLISSLVLSLAISLDRSCICADRIARFRFQWLCHPYLIPYIARAHVEFLSMACQLRVYLENRHLQYNCI